jgi:tetratricopeptide (TPR) repeat protein
MNAKLFCALLAATALPACAEVPVAPATPAPAKSAAAGQGMSPQVFYQFLLAELAGQRGDLNLSAEAYTDLAVKTRDARVARRATEISLYARQNKLALQAARLWQELEPDSGKALHTLASLLIGAGKMSEARPHLLAWIKLNKPEEAFQHLPGLIARQADRKAVLDLVSDLATAYPALPEAQLSVAQVALQAGQGQRALEAVDRALNLKPGWEGAALFKARVLRQVKDESAALGFLNEFLSVYPLARDTRLNYARQLASANRMQEARGEFQRLAQELPDNAEIRFATGLVEMQSNDLDAAHSNFSKALELGHPDAASVRFTLGQLAEMRSQWDEARTWYESIERGRQAWDAKLRIAVVKGLQGRLAEARADLARLKARDENEQTQIIQTEAQLLRDAKDLEGVYAVLSKGLEQFADNPDLLYERAMTAEKLNRLDVLEKDLRHLIKLRPDHAHAYNALGYTLADRTTRTAEALELLDKALKLAPDDPFVLDSMGWALYKAKRLGEAVSYLRRAFAGRPDPEVAAHLGEVLWVRGERDEARKIWQGSLESNPDNASLQETMSRLNH